MVLLNVMLLSLTVMILPKAYMYQASEGKYSTSLALKSSTRERGLN